MREEGSRASPPLFVAINMGCDKTCFYCTIRGENRSTLKGRLALPRLQEILAVAYEQGIRTFRFTGGEPTLHRGLGEVLLAAQELGDDVVIAMTTNGSRLERFVDVIARLEQPRIFLSVDGIDLTLRSGGDGRGLHIEKWLTPELRAVVDEIMPAAHVRLNYVLTRTSEPQLPALIEYATSRGVDLKIFELLLRDFYYAGDRPRVDVFAEQYVSVRGILESLRERYGEPQPFAGTGGRGIPMRAFHTGSNRIVYFDSAEGSHYGKTCASCDQFPCQEGLYALVLDANGTLHPAGCVNGELHERLATASRDEVTAAFERVQGAIDSATLVPEVPDIVLRASARAVA